MTHWNSLAQLLGVIGETVSFHGEEVGVNTRNVVDDTPLHVVATWGDVEAIEMLIRAGADVDAVGEDGDTPLHSALGQGHVAAAKCLLAAGAATHVVNGFGRMVVQVVTPEGLTALFADGSED